MVTVTGRAEVDRYFAQLQADMESKLLRGAARAAARVVQAEAKARCISDLVAASIRVGTKLEPGRVIARVETKGKGAFMAPWLEYGTAPHFISVDDSQREGMSVSKINRLGKAGSLVIGGKFVGDTVFHPGARPHPFLRPALDMRESEAVAAAQGYINSRIQGGRIVGADEGEA